MRSVIVMKGTVRRQAAERFQGAGRSRSACCERLVLASAFDEELADEELPANRRSARSRPRPSASRSCCWPGRSGGRATTTTWPATSPTASPTTHCCQPVGPPVGRAGPTDIMRIDGRRGRSRAVAAPRRASRSTSSCTAPGMTSARRPPQPPPLGHDLGRRPPGAAGVRPDLGPGRRTPSCWWTSTAGPVRRPGRRRGPLRVEAMGDADLRAAGQPRRVRDRRRPSTPVYWRAASLEWRCRLAHLAAAAGGGGRRTASHPRHVRSQRRHRLRRLLGDRRATRAAS